MGFYDVVLHLDSPDPAMLALVLRNAANYLNELPDEDFELIIVANGGGAAQLTKDNRDGHEQAKKVLSRGARLEICANAMRERNIGKDDIWEECVIVPAGLVEIVRLQKAGFSYIKP